jgi:hypothetical protein
MTVYCFNWPSSSVLSVLGGQFFSEGQKLFHVERSGGYRRENKDFLRIGPKTGLQNGVKRVFITKEGGGSGEVGQAAGGRFLRKCGRVVLDGIGARQRKANRVCPKGEQGESIDRTWK